MNTVDEPSASSGSCNQGDETVLGKWCAAFNQQLLFPCHPLTAAEENKLRDQICCDLVRAINSNSLPLISPPEIILSLWRACGCASLTGTSFLSPHAFLDTALYFDNISLILRAETELLSADAP